MLLLAFPNLKTPRGAVFERLMAARASVDVLSAWENLVAQDIVADDDEEE